jgi:acyl-ACP thioesterase
MTAGTFSIPTMVAAGAGRRFGAGAVVRLGDVLPSGEARLDAVARYLQDIASDDASDAFVGAAVDGHLSWVVRRTALVLRRRPRYQERLDVVTWASGIGSRWAERRTTISVDGQAAVEAAALWVCVEAATLRPARLGPRFWAVYGESTDVTIASRIEPTLACVWLLDDKAVLASAVVGFASPGGDDGPAESGHRR